MHSADAYTAQLHALLPLGMAWPREPGGVLGQLLTAFADEFARVDARADALVAEADPRATAELLPDWERVAGLPDACVTATQSTDQRRTALVARLTLLGGQSPAYFVALAAAYGYTVTITEFRPWTVGSAVSAPIYDAEWAYAWEIESGATALSISTVRMSVGDALRAWGDETLECVIRRFAPAHTIPIFTYT